MTLLDQLQEFAPTPVPGLRTDIQGALERIRAPQGLGGPAPTYAGYAPPQAPVTPSPSEATEAATPVGSPLDSLRERLDSRLSSLAFSPATQMPADPYEEAIQRILSNGRGGLGNPSADLNHAINVRAEQLRYARSPASSGGTPTGDYASLPGKYGALVDPPGGPSDLRLQKGAWQSLVSAGVPAGVILGGSYRTNAQQRAYYASDQQRYAPPGMSLHEYGLAIDVNAAQVSRVRDKLLAAGWYQERPDEPQHFSYGFFSTPTAPGTPQRESTPPPPRRPRRRLTAQQR